MDSLFPEGVEVVLEQDPEINLGVQGFLAGRTARLQVRTGEAPCFIDITEHVKDFVLDTGVVLGMIHVHSQHTTAAIVVNERESMLLQDVTAFLERLAPRKAYYHHNDFDIRTENMTAEEGPNAHAHLQNWLLGSSETIPIVDSRLALGTWQRVFLVELDMPRDRTVLLQVLGFRQPKTAAPPADRVDLGVYTGKEG